MQRSLGIKALTKENYLEVDPVCTLFVKISHQNGQAVQMDNGHWAEVFLKPQLIESVPDEVRKLFEVARGAFLYGCYFYPLFTLAVEQVFRVAEAATTHKCKSIGMKKKKETFENKVEYLIKQNVIPTQEKIEWDNIRRFRNEASHPEQQTILPPGLAFSLFDGLAKKINGLFTNP